ncbi:MAG: hypothetical protein ACTS8R_00185, partial [Arsenophonus sp. NC-QC1-MAG3]
KPIKKHYYQRTKVLSFTTIHTYTSLSDSTNFTEYHINNFGTKKNTIWIKFLIIYHQHTEYLY